MSDNPLFKRTIHKHEVPSEFLPEGNRSIRVYLPPGFQQWISYPVVYCQDGEEFFNFGRIATHSQKLILEENWDPFIIVGVDVNIAHRTSEYAPDGERYSLYTRFFAEELIPWVESHYPVRDVPDQRVLIGDSLGGAISLSLALTYPNLFNRIISLSGAYYGVYVEQIERFSSLEKLKLWMLVGLQETEYATDRGTFDFVELNRNAVRMLEERGAKLRYVEKDGEHKWGFWQNELPEALAAFLGPTPLFRN
ncbi:alpha/beta hydrolase [Cohnella cholangitidis]|uniref:Esterase family protein n=1 Tax=Cohnella cholangitidis TaxID=2598458 RepID=A0A7G5C5X3_9BACL|nr:alpha/beta hydrolase-fold protein [Cohnella cholangitidis]QMV44607.1 esterase family protein [Cohnella cholangitidis]